LSNRKLRSTQAVTLFFVPVTDGAERLESIDIAEVQSTDQQDYFGLYKDAKTALHAAAEICRAHRLCLKTLGLESGRGSGGHEGSCFAFQLGRCKGACVGKEPASLHNARARLAFAANRVASWPFRGRVAVIESDWRGCQDWHVLEQWRYLGTVRDESDAQDLRLDHQHPFDADIYRILRRFLDDPGQARIVELL
jgi:DNA polymerase-3 subunit epsilon